MKESDIERKVGDYVKSKGGLFYKFTSPARRAVPDRLVVLPGVAPFFVEFKATGEVATPAQKREHLRLSERGANIYVVDSVEDGEAVINAEINGYCMCSEL